MKGKKREDFGSRARIETSNGAVTAYHLDSLERAGLGPISKLPISIKILLEAVLRNCDGYLVKHEHVSRLASWNPKSPGNNEIPFKPARVILQDLTGVPAVVDLAAMRSAMNRIGGNPAKVNPLIPVDLVIDHSVQVDEFATSGALDHNTRIEFDRNSERYEFLRWAQEAFRNFRVVPPGTGIVHQVNLEFLAKVVILDKKEEEWLAFPDTLLGTDSHTTMINGLGVLGWGVGGIEAEAAMVGHPYYMLPPAVVGVKLSGQLREGVFATDLVLAITELLRKKGVVEKFVEFYGPGLSALALPDRATIANMAPEYGATIGFFPVDDETLRYLRLTGRTEGEVDLVERYCKEQGMFRQDQSSFPEYSETFEIDLAAVETNLAGPKRPQDKIPLSEMKKSFHACLTAPIAQRGYALPEENLVSSTIVTCEGVDYQLGHGSVVIAAITSCTNTSNPSVMIGAGLLAKKAVERGLKTPPYVKTSLAPGSKVVTNYLQSAGLSTYLDMLGFSVVGYGCTTCIGNSGPLPESVDAGLNKRPLVVAAVLSGNRNFEGRIHSQVKANYLASPLLVVAYALAGTVDLDMISEPLGPGLNGEPVYLRDIWPSQREVQDVVNRSVQPEMFRSNYEGVWEANSAWNAIPVSGGELYDWSGSSTYIHEPPYFADLGRTKAGNIRGARILALFGDSVTTDHISPAGEIAKDSPAGRYLVEHGVAKSSLNTYGARRGNDQVMVRGTFANIRLKNLLVPGAEGNLTIHFPSGDRMSIYEAAMCYRENDVPLIIVGGKEYGSGSSRDWAAKGPLLQGVRAVLVESFERIHRSNLAGMGILPLQFLPGESVTSLGLLGDEVLDIEGLESQLIPRQEMQITAKPFGRTAIRFKAISRLDSAVEVDYYLNGGILQTVLKNLMHSNSASMDN